MTTRAEDGGADERPGYELSIDTGGTFTDGFVTGNGRTVQIKVDTTPTDPTDGFMVCVQAAADALGVRVEELLAKASRVHFSSTIATNVVVQRAGAKVGLVVTAGHRRDLYGRADDGARLTAFLGAVREVDESVAEDGTVAVPVDRMGLQVAVRELLEDGVDIIVVGFARAHLNDANERAAKEQVDDSYPRHYLGAIPVLLSSQLSLHADDHGRTALAVANAYLHPELARRLYHTEDRLRERQLRRPLLVVNTDGSSTRVAKTRAVDTYNSGPSAGVLGAAMVAEAMGARSVVTFDVGGTTTDVASIGGRGANRSATTAFGDVSLPHPSIGLASFGLGGGSVIGLSDGRWEIGPQSVGAVPGPACFGLGGSQPTPTDVWLSLGYLDPSQFLSGRRILDPERSLASLRQVADQLGASTEEAALAALDGIHATLAGHLGRWAATQPELLAADPGDRRVFSYGGGGGLLAVPAAEALDAAAVVVFPHSSVFSAFGGGILPVAHKYHGAVANVADGEAVWRVGQALAGRAARDMRAEGVGATTPVVAVLAVRDFASSEVSATLPFGELAGGHPGAVPVLTGSHRRGSVQLVVRAARRSHLAVAGDVSPAEPPVRRVLLADGAVDVPVCAGLGVPGAAAVTGPAFLAARDTTVFVPPRWKAEFDDLGYGRLTKEEDRA
ncbi:MAG: hydantoinase/oxoprolinase family protein [Acidimicrobiales bacterium]